MDDPTRTRLGESREHMKQTASSAASAVQRQAQDRAEGLRHSLLSTAEHVADALDAAAGSLKGTEPWLGGATEGLSRQVRRFTERGRDRSLAQLRGDLEAVARDNPTAFMAGALALGLGIGRFLRSAPPEHHERHGHHAEPAGGTASWAEAAPGAQPRQSPATPGAPPPTATGTTPRPAPKPGGSATAPSSPPPPQGGHRHA